MKVKFIGTGEAFDEKDSNTSIIIDSKTRLLIDCGFNSFKDFFKTYPDPNFLDAIYITHFHADHALISPYLLRLRGSKRTKPLLIIGQRGTEKFVEDQFRLLYDGLYQAVRDQYNVKFKEIEQGEIFQLNELKLEFFELKHFARNLAIKVSDDKSSFVFTGDTTSEIDVSEFAKGVDLLVHETFAPRAANIKAHCNPTEAATVARKADVKKLALVHVSRLVDKNQILLEAKSIFENTFIPEDGELVDI